LTRRGILSANHGSIPKIDTFQAPLDLTAEETQFFNAFFCSQDAKMAYIIDYLKILNNHFQRQICMIYVSQFISFRDIRVK
jgi:hypothetical protein